MNGKRGRPGRPTRAMVAAQPKKPGRPPKFKTLEDLAEKVDSYFKWCEERVFTIRIGKAVKVVATPPTITRLCLHLEINKDTFYDLCKAGPFSDYLTSVKARIEADIEEMAGIGYYDSKIATLRLKNHFHWTDKTEVEQTGPALTDAQIDERIKQLLSKEEAAKPQPLKLAVSE